jgi:hypothetical protein
VVTVDDILEAFARKLTELDRRSVRLGGQALSLQDPRDIANHIHGLTYGIVGALEAIWWWVVDQAVYPSRLRNRLEARAMGRISDEPPRVTE